MGTVTYPGAKVICFINDRMVLLQVKSDAQPIATDFNVKWTHTIITFGTEGKENHRTLGFLAPMELTPSLPLGIAKVYFDADRFDNALKNLNELISKYPESDSTSEAIYLEGVCLYKKTHDVKPLKEACEKLNARDPKNKWTKHAYPYRLL